MGHIICQECFEADATMQNDEGTYMCADCHYKLIVTELAGKNE